MTTRILHVVGRMDRGGVETWLMHVLRTIDRSRFQMDFLVHTEKPSAYDDEIRALGSRIIPCLHPSQPIQYAQNFRRIMREYGAYDVVHSHVHHFSGYVLWLAHRAGVPVRIAHSHSNTSSLQAQASIPRRLYLKSMRWLIGRYATTGLGVSKGAGAALLGAAWETDARWRILYYGIDLTPFETPIDRASVRGELGIPQDAFVVGHVGRFVDVKNHRFIIQIAEELVRQKPEAYLLLVGDGPLRPAIEQQIHDVGLEGRVILAGLRDDVPRLMMGGMDVFLMPSFYEGLPMVLIEAQAAGLPCIISDVITPEIQILESHIEYYSLSQSPEKWVNRILAMNQKKGTVLNDQNLSLVANSPFNIRQSLSLLEKIYEPSR